MKCKRCGHDMKRVKLAPGSYNYRCNYCGLKIGGPAESQKEEKASDSTE